MKYVLSSLVALVIAIPLTYMIIDTIRIAPQSSHAVGRDGCGAPRDPCGNDIPRGTCGNGSIEDPLRDCRSSFVIRGSNNLLETCRSITPNTDLERRVENLEQKP